MQHSHVQEEIVDHPAGLRARVFGDEGQLPPHLISSIHHQHAEAKHDKVWRIEAVYPPFPKFNKIKPVDPDRGLLLCPPQMDAEP